MAAESLKQLSIATSALFRDGRNKLSFGIEAPRVAELIWVDPLHIERFIRTLPKGISKRNCSGRVIDFAAEGIVEESLMQMAQFRACYDHWCRGVPWKNTDDYAIMLRRINTRGSSAGCRNEAELKQRFRRLDDLFEAVARDGMFKTQKQLRRWNFRELGGVQVSINAGGEPVLIRAGGYHRLAIARIQRLHLIPAQLALVDTHAVPFLHRFREFRPAG